MSQCLLVSAAYLLGEPIETLISELGHDGTEIAFPESKNPKRGFIPDEFIDLFFKRNIAMMCVTPNPGSISEEGGNWIDVFTPERVEARVDFYLTFPAILVGRTGIDGSMHAVPWTGKRAWENGRFYESHELPLSIDQIYVLLRIKSPLEIK